MLGDREAEAETTDELKERRGEIPGVGNEPEGEADSASFYPDAGAYPAGGEMPPTGEMGDAAPTDALHPEREHEPEEPREER